MYQLTSTDNILRLVDGAIIPNDAENSAYVNYLAWLSDGNTPLPAPPPAPFVPQSISARQARLLWLNQKLLQEIEAMWPTWPSATQIDYHYAQSFTRASPAIMAVAAALNATDATVDEWFIAAAQL